MERKIRLTLGLVMLQAKPKFYGDVNKHKDESYYNYEAYEI